MGKQYNVHMRLATCDEQVHTCESKYYLVMSKYSHEISSVFKNDEQVPVLTCDEQVRYSLVLSMYSYVINKNGTHFLWACLHMWLEVLKYDEKYSLVMCK